jgi:hypothetical protein
MALHRRYATDFNQSSTIFRAVSWSSALLTRALKVRIADLPCARSGSLAAAPISASAVNQPINSAVAGRLRSPLAGSRN